MNTARYYEMSDPINNRQFHRRWHEASPLPLHPAQAAVEVEPSAATLTRWVEEWRQRRSKKAALTAGPRS